MVKEGQDVTDLVLLKMLPHSNTTNNRGRDAWIHVAPSVTKDIQQWFEGAGWTKPDDWPVVAQTILEFVRRCLASPDDLSKHCQYFIDTCPSKGFQMGLLTPILNALKTDAYNLINSKPRQVVNYFCDKKFGNNLSEYPEINKQHFELQREKKDVLSELTTDTILPCDVIDTFSHWMVAVKKHSFKEARVFRIEPGKDSSNWDENLDNGFIAFEWSELGDLSGVSKAVFKERRDELVVQHPGWTKRGTGQAWAFANIREGDRIIANKGKTEILGIGTVIGPYYFVPDVQYGHRLPVSWDDPKRRRVNEVSWTSALEKISQERFDILKDAPEIPVGPRPKPTNGLNPEYPLSKCSSDTNFTIKELELWVKAIDRKGQAILYGPPGTGKTFLAKHLAKNLIGGGDGFTQIIQFHPEYAYQDFIRGIRPITKDGSLNYKMVQGVFSDFCEAADLAKGKCVLIIDEINRANLARVFGELMYLLEYRAEEVDLPGGDKFKIPDNVRIIGTMNTADRSIALVDYALRRRFAFIRLQPDYSVLEKFHEESAFDCGGLIAVLKDLNAQIGDPHYEVGISFFLKENLENEIEDIWRMEIEPYLEEYFFDNHSKAEKFNWETVNGRIEQ